MTLEKRLKKAEKNGYVPIRVEPQNYYFFIDKTESKNIKAHSTVIDNLGIKYKILDVLSSGRMIAERI